VSWELEYTDEFGEWWDDLTEAEQDSVDYVVRMLAREGPALRFPYSSSVRGSRHGRMRELRIQHEGRPYRVFYAFDPRRVAVLLIGGDKTGNDHFYEEFIPVADKIYDGHLAEIGKRRK
jgi:hypothetical protein